MKRAASQSRAVIPAVAYLLLAAVILGSCGKSIRKLDETTFYVGPQFKLMLVRYYESIPLSYNGELYSVECASPATANSHGGEMLDAGWVGAGIGPAKGSKDAADVLKRERGNYVVVDDRTLVWLGTGFNVSFDACAHFHSWYPTSLPDDRVNPVEKPENCAPRGTADCRHYDFLGDRAPQFEEIQVNPSGHVSFVVRSKAIKNAGTARIRSTDGGRTWTLERP